MPLLTSFQLMSTDLLFVFVCVKWHRNFSPGAFQFRELNFTLQIIRQHSTLLSKGISKNIFLSLVETELKITPFRLDMDTPNQ
ncbi:hypothetical protein ACQJBY_008797 [Aegilops geniculata]